MADHILPDHQVLAHHYDRLETRDPTSRELALLRRLRKVLAAAATMPGWRAHLGQIEPRRYTSRQMLARLPVLRKADLPALQKAAPPFAGLTSARLGEFGRLYTSPGPIYEPEGAEADAWQTARGLFGAGLRAGDVVLNTFSYHLTPGGFIFDSGARALGCAVIPAGPGHSEQILDVVQHYRPTAYAGTADFLKILLDKASETGKDASSIKKAIVSGAAFPPSLQQEIKSRGIEAYQLFATADLGTVAYETPARQGLVLNENLILEIVRPGTVEPVSEGEVGEMVVTRLDPRHPIIRLALGDMSATLAGPSPCGRTNVLIKGWMGRADQTAKIKGMFVRPEQVAEIARRHPEIARLRLVVGREGEQDTMALHVEAQAAPPDFAGAVAETLHTVTKLKGQVVTLAPGALPNDGKVIADERPV